MICELFHFLLQLVIISTELFTLLKTFTINLFSFSYILFSKTLTKNLLHNYFLLFPFHPLVFSGFFATFYLLLLLHPCTKLSPQIYTIFTLFYFPSPFTFCFTTFFIILLCWFECFCSFTINSFLLHLLLHNIPFSTFIISSKKLLVKKIHTNLLH